MSCVVCRVHVCAPGVPGVRVCVYACVCVRVAMRVWVRARAHPPKDRVCVCVCVHVCDRVHAHVSRVSAPGATRPRPTPLIPCPS